MQHIIKIGGIPSELQGVQKVQEYLDNNWGANGPYNNPKYGKSIRSRLRPILAGEQRDYCCYCMRKLYIQDINNHKANVTLEHIVPNKINPEEWNRDKAQYQTFTNLTNTYIDICPGGVLQAGQNNIKVTNVPHPHFVSYHNLVASCDGRTLETGVISEKNCCNNKRGNAFVLPMYLSNDVENEIGYDRDGKLDYDPTVFQDDWFQILNLNCDWLKLVRKIWYKISQSDYTERDIDNAINDRTQRHDIIDDIDNENEISSWATNDVLWNLFSEYSWFYQYYKTKYPA